MKIVVNPVELERLLTHLLQLTPNFDPIRF